MAQRKRARLFEHPVAFGSFRNWTRLLWSNKDIDRKYLPRALAVLLSTLFTSPFKAYETMRFSRTVKKTAIHPSPIFIIGHWRTGTTHLHNLLCQDKNNGYVSTFQAFAPSFCLVGEKSIKKLLNVIATKLHPTREIDNIPLSMDNPEEEDLAIACLTPYSYLHMYTFPRKARFFFETYITNFHNLPSSIITQWKDKYLTMLRKATLGASGKRLIIKNCADSARIKTILELFPDAKFIHIYRNPYHVFRSTKFLYNTVLARSQLQGIAAEEIEQWVINFYAQLMQKLFADKSLIPPGNLVELKYEELITEPLDQLRKIYEVLDLPGFDEAEPAFRAYLESVTGYQKNPQEIDNSIVTKVNENWLFALNELGYERREPGSQK